MRQLKLDAECGDYIDRTTRQVAAVNNVAMRREIVEFRVSWLQCCTGESPEEEKGNEPNTNTNTGRR